MMNTMETLQKMMKIFQEYNLVLIFLLKCQLLKIFQLKNKKLNKLYHSLLLHKHLNNKMIFPLNNNQINHINLNKIKIKRKMKRKLLKKIKFHHFFNNKINKLKNNQKYLIKVIKVVQIKWNKTHKYKIK